jgi:hypothetical protein
VPRVMCTHGSSPHSHGKLLLARRRSPLLRRSDDGVDRELRGFNALRGRVCRICTHLFAFPFTFVPVRNRACPRLTAIGRAQSSWGFSQSGGHSPNSWPMSAAPRGPRATRGQEFESLQTRQPTSVVRFPAPPTNLRGPKTLFSLGFSGEILPRVRAAATSRLG